jgi:hypothetical protein
VKGPITLITNNFKIKSTNQGVIFTYRVDFIEMNKNSSEESKSQGNHSGEGHGSFGQLETFQKYRIINAYSKQLKSIFLQFVFVGSNLFSTSDHEDIITLETTTPFHGKFFTIKIQKASAFQLDELNQAKMEDHPVALIFLNNIIKNALRNSNLQQIGRNPRFFMPSQAKAFQD